MYQHKSIKFGSDIDTDQIIAACHLVLPSLEDMAFFCFENHRNFTEHYSFGDYIVAEENFGCGSSREQAPAVLKERGIGGIIAVSFARIFFRNAINLGVNIYECEQAVEIKQGDRLAIRDGTIKNLSQASSYTYTPHPDFLQKIVNDGGIAPHLRKHGQVCRH